MQKYQIGNSSSAGICWVQSLCQLLTWC